MAGDCWVQLLNAEPSAIILIKSLLTREVTSLRGALFRRPGKAEPSLPPLGPASVCVALVALLRKRVEDQQDSPAVVPALQALAGPLPQQLPPCDWSFLVELAKRDECCLLCVTIATAQAHWSPSAQAAADLMVKNICAQGRTKVRIFFTTLFLIIVEPFRAGVRLCTHLAFLKFSSHISSSFRY